MQAPIPATFFALTFGLLLHPISTGTHHSSNSRHLQKKLEDVFMRFSPLVKSHATLNYGESCVSPYEEKLRQEIAEDLHKIATSRATLSLVKGVIKKMEKFISMNGKELCNYRLFLVCDEDLRKCVCGPSRTNISFVWEDDTCRYAEGSLCSTSKVECSRDTKCVSLQSFEECSGDMCFCQREYIPTTTTPAPQSTTDLLSTAGGNGLHVPMILPPDEVDEDDDFDEDSNISGGDDNESENEVAPHHYIPPETYPTKEVFIERQSSSSEEEPDFEERSNTEDDDDIGNGEREKIIEVNFADKTGEYVGTTSLPPPPAEEDFVQILTTVPTPVGTSPTPTRRQELTSAIRRLEEEVETSQRLGFNDQCMSINEESNYADYRRLVNDMNCVTDKNDEENLIEILGKLEAILEGGNLMCNTTQHLQCDGQAKRCKCRTSSEDLDGFYLLFAEEDRHCVLVDNSRCLSREYLISKKWPVTEIPCASESVCISQETKAECKSKIENCFCRKPATTTTPKPTEAAKKAKKAASSGVKVKPVMANVKSYFQFVIFVGMIIYLMLLPRLVLVI